ncbi:MAG TPA: ATP-binding protein, partial [Polyangiaceae bacterium]
HRGSRESGLAPKGSEPRDNDELMRVLLEHSPSAIAIVDRGMRYIEVSQRWIDFFELGGQEVIGRSHDELLPGAPATWSESRSLRSSEGPSEETYTRRDGTIEWLRWNVSPWRERSGEVGGLVLSAELVSETKEAERALRAGYEQLRTVRLEVDSARRDAEVANRMKNDFLALLGHELRNPLAPIQTALELIKIRDNDASVRERAIIERQMQHLVLLVDDLLDMSRITRGQVELKRSSMEVAHVIGLAVEKASPLFERRSHNLKVAVQQRGLLVHGDEGRLSQIFSNLLTNAAKYTDPGGQIVVSAANENGRVLVRVRDTGCGIPEDMIPQVFDMFVQGGEHTLDRSRGGLGLGLTIVRSLVELHGGKVTVHSDGAGTGSEFVVSLPAVLQQQLDLPEEESEEAHADVHAAGRRVLVVDDNTDAAELLADILREHGHETSVAHDGPTALTKALVFRPDVALLDIGLPVMDGYELARRFRDLPELKRVQLLAVTGYGQQEDKERSRAAGFYEHLVKPIDFSRLRALIDHVSDTGRASEQA